MKNIKKLAVSPTIGVILVVALSVALVVFAASTVFDISSNVEKPLSASIQTSLDKGEIDVQVLRNSNLDRVLVKDIEGEIVESRNLNQGEVAGFTAIPTGGGTYQVVGEQNGRQQVVRQYEVAAVRINMSLGGEITDDAVFNITHKGGDTITASDMQIWVDATDACKDTDRILNLPADGGASSPTLESENVASGDGGESIISTGFTFQKFGVIHELSDNYNNGLYEDGEKIGFSVAETDCLMDVGDNITVSVVDITDNPPVIVGQGDYTVESVD